MADDKGTPFGTQFVVSIKVPGATYTPTEPVTASDTPLPDTDTPEPSDTDGARRRSKGMKRKMEDAFMPTPVCL